MKKEIIKVDLLGSTGSIGEQAVDVVRKLGAEVTCLCANKNYKRVEAQAREFKPAFCAMYDYEAAKDLKLALADTGRTKIKNKAKTNTVNFFAIGLPPIMM